MVIKYCRGHRLNSVIGEWHLSHNLLIFLCVTAPLRFNVLFPGSFPAQALRQDFPELRMCAHAPQQGFTQGHDGSGHVWRHGVEGFGKGGRFLLRQARTQDDRLLLVSDDTLN